MHCKNYVLNSCPKVVQGLLFPSTESTLAALWASMLTTPSSIEDDQIENEKGGVVYDEKELSNRNF